MYDTHVTPPRLFLACMTLTATAALPLAGQFEASAVVQYAAEEIVLGFTPTAMNKHGWIVGYSNMPYRAMRYRPGVGTEQLSDLSSMLNDINDAGTAIGYISQGEGRKAMIRPAGAPWQIIGTLGGHESVAHAINESGQVVGWSEARALTGFRPFLYSQDEGMKMLFNAQAIPNSINEAGQVTGFIYSGAARGFMWDPSLGLIDFGARLGLGSRYNPAGISDDGTVSGIRADRQFATFSLSAGIRQVGERNPMSITDVNGRGWTVGSFGFDRMAFLYVYGQGIRDLNSLLLTPLPKPLAFAIAINNRDDILARTASPVRYYVLKRVR